MYLAMRSPYVRMYISLHAAEIIFQPAFIDDERIRILRSLEEIIIIIFISWMQMFDMEALGTSQQASWEWCTTGGTNGRVW